MATPLIHLRQLSKIFYTDQVETHALRDVQLAISKGEFLSIAGPSGCGKSTLLAIIGLLDAPTGGEYALDGRLVQDLSIAERAKYRNEAIGFVFQAFNLIGDLTIFENVELPLVYREMPSRDRRDAVNAALERVGMMHRANHFPSQLSGGQQQRVAVARAIVGRPLMILADEPTGNLDSRNGQVVMDLMTELHEEGATVCMVTHDPRYAGVAERTVQLFDGRVIDESLNHQARAL